MIKREEGILYHFYNFFLENKDKLSQDEFVMLCEKNLSDLFGGQSLFDLYESVGPTFKESKFEDSELGLAVQFPKNWIIGRKAQADGTRSLNLIVEASPQLITNTKVIISILKIDIEKTRLKEYHEEFNESDFDTYLESTTIVVDGVSGHKLVYTTSLKSLVNKTVEIWLPIKNKIYEIKYDASNESQYDLFMPDFEKILSSIEIDSKLELS